MAVHSMELTTVYQIPFSQKIFSQWATRPPPAWLSGAG